jgi:preprotein translocase subunit SecD
VTAVVSIVAILVKLGIGYYRDHDRSPDESRPHVTCDYAGYEGGMAIVLVPATPAPVDHRTLVAAADVVCQRTATLVTQAKVTVEDGTIVARLGGVSDATEAMATLPMDGLELRPVLAVAPSGDGPAPTTPDGEVARQHVVLAGADGQVYTLGPSAMTGAAVQTASAEHQPGHGWEVDLVLQSGDDGIDSFNAAARSCAARARTCPTRRLAFVVGSQVVAAPDIRQRSFARDQIRLTGGLDETEALALATEIGSGVLPVELRVESAQTFGAS